MDTEAGVASCPDFLTFPDCNLKWFILQLIKLVSVFKPLNLEFTNS